VDGMDVALESKPVRVIADGEMKKEVGSPTRSCIYRLMAVVEK
jgi:hypothetical protein